jgi:hypothetical protein|tara:strand:+ start:485 stop:958 length:474 start_codon:yes stop_codon:yes gene_type:complete
MKINNKLAQEEMVGFALIIIVVAVILLVFVGFSLKNQEKETVESYEVESFTQSFLQYTTDCRDNLKTLSIQRLISNCRNNRICLDGRNTCEVLNSTLKGIVEESWKISTETAIKGYGLKIVSDGKEMLKFEKGNITVNSKGSVQYFPNIEIFFTAYY